MPARKPKPPGEKSQRERFIETARAIGASEDPEDFERIFHQVMRPKDAPKHAVRKITPPRRPAREKKHK